MKLSKLAAVVVAAAFGLGVSAMAQGRGGGRPAGGPPAGPGAGMGGSGMGGSMGQQMGQMGQSQRGQMGQMGQMGQSQRGQMGQTGQTGTHSRRPTVSDLLTQNTKLSSQLQSILGLSSSSALQTASSGYKNLGQFVAAVHLYKNLKIPGAFNQFSTDIKNNGGNLGKTIHSLQPNLSNHQVKSAVRTAKRQAKQDMRNSKS